MKKTISKFLSKPSVAIPIMAIIVIIAGVFSYTRIGNAPVVPSMLISPDTSTIAPGSNVSLSFSQTGRVEVISVKNGQEVTKGQVLAKLSAPQAEGAISQAKGALDLAEAKYSSLNVQYTNAKKQQDILVDNAYKTLLSSNLEGVSDIQDPNVPIISGTYTCGKEGSYILKPYVSGDSDTRTSVNFSGLETGTTAVKYTTAVPLGNCGLQVKFLHVANFNPYVTWTVTIPNTKGSSYLANKNAYDLAVNTREKVLSELSSTIGKDGASSVAKAEIDAARGAYEAAVGAYQNYVIVSPVNGVVNFVDTDLKVGQNIVANRSVISISAK